jgi:DNA mismatch repair protein MutS2
VRGMRALEVIPVLDKFLDDALLHKWFSLKVLHGKGDGVLRAIIRDNLSNYTFVDKYGDAHMEAGGDGITLIELRKS